MLHHLILEANKHDLVTNSYPADSDCLYKISVCQYSPVLFYSSYIYMMNTVF